MFGESRRGDEKNTGRGLARGPAGDHLDGVHAGGPGPGAVQRQEREGARPWQRGAGGGAEMGSGEGGWDVRS